MQRLTDWFLKKHKYIPFLIWSLLIIIAWNLIAILIMTYYNITIPVPDNSDIQLHAWYLPLQLFFYAFVEECFFRLPLALPIYFIQKPIVTYIAAMILPAIFGYLHGGWPNIVLQGFAGLVYSVIFLKFGGLEKHFVKGLLASSFAHFLHNLTLALLLLACGSKTL